MIYNLVKANACNIKNLILGEFKSNCKIVKGIIKKNFKYKIFIEFLIPLPFPGRKGAETEN